MPRINPTAWKSNSVPPMRLAGAGTPARFLRAPSFRSLKASSVPYHKRLPRLARQIFASSTSSTMNDFGVSFWNSEPGVVEKLGESVVEVGKTPGEVEQRNCLIQPLRLTLSSGDFCDVVVKHIRLNPEYFRDEQHLKRTQDSYQVETAFYRNFARKAVGGGAHVSEPVLVRWSADTRDVVIVLRDLRSDPLAESCGITGRSTQQMLVLNREQAEVALGWLARFHASFWGSHAASDGELWVEGSYWSLDKRRSDLSRMEMEWAKTVGSFAQHFTGEFSDEGIRSLGSRLLGVAGALDQALMPDQYTTLVHGDFKTANMFFKEEDVSVCDFQWTGPGLGVKDVVYMLWTSVDPDVVRDFEAELLNHYHDCLNELLSKRNGFSTAYPKEAFSTHCDFAFLDYVRFLVGTMWGSVTPENCQEKSTSINHGTHKRHPEHLVRMAMKASKLLDTHETALSSRNLTDNGAEVQGKELIASLLARCVVLSAKAGACVRDILGASAGKLASREKDGDGPQTEADLASEKLIISGLFHSFPNLTVIGEEGICEYDGTDNLKLDESQGGVGELIRDALGDACVWDGAKIEDLTVWVDPLDGTKELLDGNLPAVTVLIGVAWKGKPLVGVVHQPFVSTGTSTGQTWWGGEGLGVFLDSRRFEVGPTNASQCVVATTRSNSSPDVEEIARKLNPDKVLHVGGAGNKVIMLLLQEITHYAFGAKGTKRWDTCAPEAVLRGVGGRLVGADGEEYDYSSSVNPQNLNGLFATATESAWERMQDAFQWER
ncbi:hypothetical protein BSKO_06509 [Bryopsis sp. KO-2023]|nr:hypothetical protein BSKO_06509 [Bryopsis sp. KO-2023]